MSKDQKDLLRRLDALNNNIETLTKIIAVSIGKETFFKEKKQKEQQIEFLSELGPPRNIIASIVVTTPLTVSVTKSQKNQKRVLTWTNLNLKRTILRRRKLRIEQVIQGSC